MYNDEHEKIVSYIEGTDLNNISPSFFEAIDVKSFFYTLYKDKKYAIETKENIAKYFDKHFKLSEWIDVSLLKEEIDNSLNENFYAMDDFLWIFKIKNLNKKFKDKEKERFVRIGLGTQSEQLTHYASLDLKLKNDTFKIENNLISFFLEKELERLKSVYEDTEIGSNYHREYLNWMEKQILPGFSESDKYIFYAFNMIQICEKIYKEKMNEVLKIIELQDVSKLRSEDWLSLLDKVKTNLCFHNWNEKHKNVISKYITERKVEKLNRDDNLILFDLVIDIMPIIKTENFNKKLNEELPEKDKTKTKAKI